MFLTRKNEDINICVQFCFQPFYNIGSQQTQEIIDNMGGGKFKMTFPHKATKYLPKQI